MYRDDYLPYFSVWYIIRTLSAVWYIAFVDWLSRITTTDVYVTLTPNFWQVWGYPNIIGQNKKTDTTIWFYAHPINDQEGLL